MNPVSLNADNVIKPQETPVKSSLKKTTIGNDGKGEKQVEVADKVTIGDARLSDPDKAGRLAEALRGLIRSNPQAAVSAFGKMEPENVENLLKGFPEG